MHSNVPRFRVPRAPGSLALEDAALWRVLSPLSSFILAAGRGQAQQQTTARLCYDLAAFYVRYDCEDRDIWGTFTRRDDPIYDEEVVELMIAPGIDDPTHYFEFEVSPNGVLFDATVFNPSSTRADLQWDARWNCPGVQWTAGRDDAANRWWAALAIPWAGITKDAQVPPFCRANLYRIDRPRDGATEYSCWSPTMTDPADFHKPAHFGLLEFS